MGGGPRCHRRGNIAPTPHQIDYRRPPPSFLTLRRFPGGDSPATSASFCLCRAQRGRGGGGVWRGVRYRGAEGGGGGGGSFWGMYGGVETLNPPHASFLPQSSLTLPCLPEASPLPQSPLLGTGVISLLLFLRVQWTSRHTRGGLPHTSHHAHIVARHPLQFMNTSGVLPPSF